MSNEPRLWKPEKARPQAGVWRHFKGALYVVIGSAHHHETRELGAVYFPLEPHGDQDPAWNWRPLHGDDGWFTPVLIDLKKQPATDQLRREGFQVATAGEAWYERFTFLHPINS